VFDGGRNLGYGFFMTEKTPDNDDYEEEELGPSLAIPPLYLLRAASHCPGCGKVIPVYTLGCAAFQDAQEGGPADIFHFLRLIRSVPEPVLDLLKAKCPSFYLDQEDGDEPPYLMNHCGCGAKLDDDCLHGDFGAAFVPDTEEGYEDFKVFLLPIEEDIPVECSFSVGGGEYLDTEHAAPW
jgi:hypothetical protein